MSTVASPPTVRHGVCSLTVVIGATEYRCRPARPLPPGFRAVWVLRKLDPAGPSVTYAVAAPADRAEPAGCTCPDHSVNGAVCKHIMALRALTLIPGPKEKKPRPAST